MEIAGWALDTSNRAATVARHAGSPRTCLQPRAENVFFCASLREDSVERVGHIEARQRPAANMNGARFSRSWRRRPGVVMNGNKERTS